MKNRLGITLGLTATMLASPVLAQETEVGVQASKKGSVGAQVELLPSGTLSIDGPGVEGSSDTEVAYAIGGTFDYDVTPFVSIGAAPRLILNVLGTKASDGTDAAKQLDLRARVRVHGELAPKLQAYGFLAPGYSVIFIPDNDDDDPAGFVLGLGGGVTYDVSSTAFVSAELGYQLGFQSVDIDGTTVDLATDYLHLGIGAGTRF